jgi:hypothetical protein
MNILGLVVGKPIKTSDERAEKIGPAQGIPIGQHSVRRFSPALPRHRAKQLPPARLRVPRAAACLYLRHRCPVGTQWRSSHSFWWCHRQAHPALCCRRIPGFHALAVRHGRALAEKSWAALAEERPRQWIGGARHGSHRRRRAGCEIR